MTDERLLELVDNPSIVNILQFVRENQGDPHRSVTKGKVVRHMEENKICSRLTTLSAIQRLLDQKVLLTRKTGNGYYNNLSINESFPFKKVEEELLASYAKKVQNSFALIRGSVRK